MIVDREFLEFPLSNRGFSSDAERGDGLAILDNYIHNLSFGIHQNQGDGVALDTATALVGGKSGLAVFLGGSDLVEKSGIFLP